MKTRQQLQPNFEEVKRAFYQHFINHPNTDFSLLMERVKIPSTKPLHERRKEFDRELNEWLDRLDIRVSGTLIDVLVKDGARLPAWMKNKKYSIEYNRNDMLDLIH
jgi:hypothetical protein